MIMLYWKESSRKILNTENFFSNSTKLKKTSTPIKKTNIFIFDNEI